MTFLDLTAGILATWALIYLTTFSWLTEGLRARLGIVEEKDDQGQETRNAYTLAGAWINCPSCMAFVGIFVGLWLLFLPKWPVYVLAVPGGAMLVGRWWVGQRVKARWWE